MRRWLAALGLLVAVLSSLCLAGALCYGHPGALFLAFRLHGLIGQTGLDPLSPIPVTATDLLEITAA
ncbi:MAG: hypothetical protein M1401_01740 [Chloroflexi bacterium]|nr:hypothetical protein [Chloroflexota bacterium]